MTDRSVIRVMVPAMPTIETSLGTLAYDVRGGGSQTLVLLASGAHDRSDFDALRAALGERLRTIAIEWPGHGDSSAPTGTVSATRFADVAEEAVAQLAPEGTIVLGNSIGGFSAARLAIRRPELVRGLVIVDGGGFAGRGPLVKAFCAVMARPRLLRAIYPTFARRYMRARTDADRRALEVAIATTRADPGLRTISELWRSFASPEHDLRADAKRISAPTLVAWGRRDPVIPLKIGKRAAKMIDGAQLEVFDSGHVPFTTEPERFAELLLDFAARLDASEPAISRV
jgi:pimeloyl-ACP methyl ester carboxylesterase